MYFKKFSSSFKRSLRVKSRIYDLSKEQIIIELLFFWKHCFRMYSLKGKVILMKNIF
jgi:hypothetical protein